MESSDTTVVAHEDWKASRKKGAGRLKVEMCDNKTLYDCPLKFYRHDYCGPEKEYLQSSV